MWVPCFVEIWMKGVADLVTSLNSGSALKELDLAHYFLWHAISRKDAKTIVFSKFFSSIVDPHF